MKEDMTITDLTAAVLVNAYWTAMLVLQQHKKEDLSLEELSREAVKTVQEMWEDLRRKKYP